MICAIMQPTYLPWYGYFAMISKVDVFVFLDDVQFEKRSWQSRNRIKNNGKETFLSVSTRSASRSALINEIEVNDQADWRGKHRALVREAYRAAPYFKELEPILDIVSREEIQSLCELNIELISFICKRLGVETQLLRSSTLDVKEKRAMKLGRICQAIGATEYLSPPGSAAYLEEDNFKNEFSEVNLEFFNFDVSEYYQGKGEYIPRLSIIDFIAWLGFSNGSKFLKV